MFWQPQLLFFFTVNSTDLNSYYLIIIEPMTLALIVACALYCLSYGMLQQPRKHTNLAHEHILPCFYEGQNGHIQETRNL